MNNIEDRIKNEYHSMKLPDNNIGIRVKERINVDIEKKESEYRGKYIRAIRFARAAGIAALIALIITFSSAGIYAAYKGLTIAQIFGLIWGDNVSEKIQDTISCDAELISEKNEFNNLDIHPVRVIGDVRGIYVVFELRTDDEHISKALDTGKVTFYDYSLEYDGSGSSGSSIYILGNSGESWYMAVEYLGGDDGRSVADNRNVTISFEDLYTYDSVEGNEPCVENEANKKDKKRIVMNGSYEAVISYEYISNNVSYTKDDCEFNISALTISVSAENEQKYYEMLDKNLTIELKDGSKLETEFIYGLENAGNFAAIYNIGKPIDPMEVSGCVTR